MKLTTIEVSGLSAAIKGMRFPLNSNHLSDSEETFDERYGYEFIIGEKDLNLAQRLINAGSEHRKLIRQIFAWVEIEAPRYWWAEFDTYKVGGITANSTSTMHKLFDKKSSIGLDMFEVHTMREVRIVNDAILELNELREEYFEATTQEEKNQILTTAKRILPESYINKRMICMNYETIRTIMGHRRNHRLKYEWQECFCKWATTLPYSKELIFCGYEEEFERLRGM